MRSLNWIFLWSSVVLLAVTALMVGYDYLRGWKWFQLEFMRMQRDRITQDMQRAEQDENGTQLTGLDRSILAQKDLDAWEGEHYRADQDYRFGKATLDAQRYNAETSTVQHRADAMQQQAEYERLTKHVNELQLRLQEVTRRREASKANVDQWLVKIKDAEDKRKELTASVDLLN